MRPDWGYYGTYDESGHADLWDGVVAYWAPCLGPTGLRLHDVSRWNNWGTLTNMTAADDWVIDSGQYALDFDGSNDSVSITTASVLPLGSVSRSMSIWFKINTDTNASIAGYGGNGNNERFNFFRSTNLVGTNVIGIEITNSWSLFSFTNDSKWHMLTAVYPGGTLSATQHYLDGVTQTATSVSGGANTPNTTAGAPAMAMLPEVSAFYFNGQLDDYLVWNRPLSPNEVQRLYQLGRGGMLERRRRRRVYVEQAGFRAHYRAQRAQLIGGGLR